MSFIPPTRTVIHPPTGIVIDVKDIEPRQKIPDNAHICICGRDWDKEAGTFIQRQGGNYCRWDNANWDEDRWIGEPRRLPLTWFLRGSFSGGPEIQQLARQAIQAACNQWSKDVALSFTEAPNAQSANIVMDVGSIDGQGGTLAWSHLPCGPDRQLKQRYDDNEHWWWHESSPQFGIHFIAVCTHELGHALGMEHTNAGGLMDPMYSPRVLSPRPSDTSRMIYRYGPAADVKDDPTPTPNPNPNPTPGQTTIRLPNPVNLKPNTLYDIVFKEVNP